VAADTLVLDYNNIEQLEACFKQYGEELACVIVEPVAGNMNLVRGNKAWLTRMRELCTQYETVLIWDEVMSGFRVALGCAQALYGITPDLTTLGKVIGGGLPVAAFGGRADIMKHLAPLGGVYQAGTLSGNPVAVAAGLTTLRLIQSPGFHDRLGQQTGKLIQGLVREAAAAGITMCGDSVGGMFGFYFCERVPTTLHEVSASDIERFKRFFHAMLDRGVYLAPSAYEAGFVSACHDDAVIEATLEAARGAFRNC
jgi:glutamate-1-semialdehyde 2,1-aminomutase